MATLQEIDAAIQRKSIDAAIQRRQAVVQAGGSAISRQEALAIQKGPFESVAIGVGRGLKNVTDALGFTETSAEERQAFERLQKESPAATEIGQVVGEVAPFAPVGLAAGAVKSVLPRVAASTAAGVAEGGAIARGRGGSASEQIKGAAIGGAITGTAESLFPVISRIGGALFRKVIGKDGRVLDRTGNPTPEFQRVMDESSVSFDDITETAQGLGTVQAGGNAAQVERKAFIESQGFTPTKAQVTRDATDFQAQQEAIKTSGPVRAALEEQERLLVNKFDEAVAGTGGDAVTSGSPAIDAITNKSKELDNQISQLYKEARKISDISGERVRLVKLKNLIGKSRFDDSLTGGVVSSVEGDLINKGIIKGDSLKSISVNNAEKLRIGLNQLFTSTNDFGKSKIREFKNAIDEDVLGQAGEDIFNKARTAKAAFERDLSRSKISKFDKNEKSLVRDMLENKIDGDDFAKKVVFSKSYRASDLQALKKYLATGTEKQRQSGVKAWQDLRAETLEIIKDTAFVGAKDEAGNRALSPAALSRVLKSIGKPRINILFRPKEQKFLKDMTRLSELRQPVSGTALGKGPSAQAVSALLSTIKSSPLFGALVEGVSVNRAGRAVLDATPAKKVTAFSQRRRDLLSASAQVAVPVAIEDPK